MSAAEAHESREGELLSGKYKLDKLLGSGGMGEVYRAENRLIGRTVAIKVLRPEFAKKAEVVARFLQEGRAANLVRHPNVVDVLDVGQDESGTPFIVQEFLRGVDLSKYLEMAGGCLALEIALATLIPVIDAVGVAHSKGVVHRDLKPENIFLAESDNDGEITPKLLDFGISQIALKPGAIRLTAPGTALGTPAYMSPEQVLGKPTDERTDVWSLGVILYESVSGAMPFQADNASAYMVKVASEDARPIYEVASHLSPELVRVIGRCLRRDPDARYPSASELARDLRLLRSGHSPSPTGEHAAYRASEPSLVSGRSSLARVSSGMPLPELDLDADELLPVQQAMAYNASFGSASALGQHAQAPPPPPPARVAIARETEVVIDLDLGQSTRAEPAKRKIRPRRANPTVRPDYTVRNASLFTSVVAVLAGAVVVLSAKLDLRSALTALMEGYAELSYWWLRASFSGVALVAVVVTLYFAIRTRPNSLPLAVSGIGVLGVLVFEALSAIALFGNEGGDRALAIPRWFLVSTALFAAGWAVHAGVFAFRALFVEDDARFRGVALTLVAVLVLPLSLEVSTLYAAPLRMLHDPTLRQYARPSTPRHLAKGLERLAAPGVVPTPRAP
jgi:serine/threonine protein kinase